VNNIVHLTDEGGKFKHLGRIGQDALQADPGSRESMIRIMH
jgi:hypothetical protein